MARNSLHNLIKPLVFSLMLLVGMMFFGDIAQAQTNANPSPQTTAQSQAAETTDGDGSEASDNPIPVWTATLENAEQALDRDGTTQGELDQIEASANEVITEAQALVEKLTPEQQNLKSQIDALGPKPEGEATESEELATQRTSLNERFNAVDGQVKAARAAIVRAERVKAKLSSVLRNRFVRSIFQRSESLVSIQFWQEFAAGIPVFNRSVGLLAKDSNAVFVNRLSEEPWRIGALSSVIAIVILLFFYARKLFLRLRAITLSETESQRLRKAMLAGVSIFRTGFLNAGLLLVTYLTLDRLNLLTRGISTLLWEAVVAVGFVLLALAVARVFLSPSNEELRYADLSDRAAGKVTRLGTIALVLVALFHIANEAAVQLISPFELSIGFSALLALTVVIFTVRIMVVIASDRSSRVQSVLGEKGVFRWLNIKPLIWLAVAAMVLALVTAYVAFAEFAAVQLVVASAILAFLWLVLEFLDAARTAYFEDEGFRKSNLTRFMGVQPERISQVSILGFGVTKLFAVLIAALAILSPWGIRTDDWIGWVSNAFFGFQVGDLTVSVSSILLALVLFLIGYIVTRTLKNWLSNQFLPATKLDLGMRNSISTVLGYVGVVIAAMLAVGAAGIDLSNLAIVAGALSVGVGFGLQSIVNNFVSGLILLAERPIKAGDWVRTTGGEGTVKRISVRSTEIETFDRASVIVPNSTLITDPVTNWTHKSKFGRVGIAIGVGYDSDPDTVRRILIECFEQHPGILGKPAPDAFFMDFGDNALLFEVRGFLSNIEDGFGVKSDLRFAIFRALRNEGIEIPFPQRDIHIKTGASTEVDAKSEPKPKRTAKSTSAKRTTTKNTQAKKSAPSG